MRSRAIEPRPTGDARDEPNDADDLRDATAAAGGIGMNERTLLGAALALAVIAAAGFAVFAGVGPVPGGDVGGGADATGEEVPATESTTSGGGGGSADGEPFSFGVDEVEACGRTCRDVTATLHNERAEPASDVTAHIRIYAGEDATDSGDAVWEETVDVGTLEANASTTTTERIDLSLREALAVERRGGWITIRTTVESAEATVTFRESRQVA